MARVKFPPTGRATGPGTAGWPEDGAGNCCAKKSAAAAGALAPKATG